MKKIRTIGEIEAITRFMYQEFRTNLIENEEDLHTEIEEYEDLDNVYLGAYHHAVKALLNHLETVEELELKK